MNASRSGSLGGPVAVTGATGFIGRALCRRLADLDVPVRALVRRSGDQLPEGVRPVHGSLTSGSALNELVRGARVVIHCAGAVRGGDRAAFDAVNVIGTRELLATIAVRAPGAHVVLISTLAAREPALSDYAASKRAAESLLDQQAPFTHTILRPTAVYGPGDVELQPLLTTMARGLAAIPGSADNRVTLVHVDDLVDAIIAATDPAVGPGPYEIADGRADGYRWPELATAVSAISGRRTRLLTVPTGALAAVAQANRFVARIFARAPMLTPGKVRELTHADWSCDTQPFRAASGWAPRIALNEGLGTVLGDT
ncbi:MAG TPA: NAD-dependent epimerase/dehydratase family protein [Pseudomonadales bacterium]|nr:NAD-dependent epimerase/dehydratase family protein [Pseudomonadales bacterium]